MRISVERLTKRFGDVVAVDDLNLDIADGELIVLLGPSGCGKTTTMRSIIGLEAPTTGRIVVGDTTVFDGRQAINVPTNKRKMGMVFQSYAIWPHKTVFENVSYPLERQGVARNEIEARVNDTLEMVGLAHLSGRGATLLSGGQMQRVALARSVVARPRVLLLDEPLSNLDAKLRDHLRFELREIQQRLGITTVYVTHDQTEALALADRIAVMKDGKIIQLDTPNAIYRNPANTFVADFLGVGNILPGRVTGRRDGKLTEVAVGTGGQTLLSATPAEIGSDTNICIRPEHVLIAAHGSSAPARPATAPATANVWPVTVRVATFLGNHVRYLVEFADAAPLHAISYDTDRIFASGSVVDATISAEHAQLLAKA